MQRFTFVLSFVALAVVFVPVIFFFGLIAFAVPAVCGLFALLFQLLHMELASALWLVLHLCTYLGIYWLVARGLWWTISWIPKPAVRTFLLSMLLMGVFSCSFARVLTYSSIQGSGGTYTFWTAVNRYLEKRPVW